MDINIIFDSERGLHCLCVDGRIVLGFHSRASAMLVKTTMELDCELFGDDE